MEFKIGDKVILRKDSVYFGDVHQLPPNVVGTIVEVNENEHLPYVVGWEFLETNDCNSYSKDDIKIVVINSDLAKVLHPYAKESKDGKYLFI